MLIIGLTGSIGMGKSTVAGMFRQRGIGVFDADAEVHRLYAGGNAVARIEAAFPGTTNGGSVNRSRLAAALGSDVARFRVLEKIVHPLVRDAEQRFLDDANRSGAATAVLEIPLLFETGLHAHVDVVVVVSAPADLQKARVLDRPGMSAARLEALLAQQHSDDDKRRRADFVVDTGASLADTEAQVDRLLSELNPDSARAYERDWRKS
jgi:dephospho-CoA kinase